MITYRKLSAEGAGKLIVAYLREHRMEPDQDARFERGSQFASGDRLVSYYTGRDDRGHWRSDMGPQIAEQLGIDPTQLPTDEALIRLFEAKRSDTGESWAGTGRKRELSAWDFTASPDKSVSLAIEFANTTAEKALLWHLLQTAGDRAMRFVVDEIGVARRASGKETHLEPGEVAWVSFNHHTSRPAMAIQDGPDGATASVEVPVPGDPQAHIHYTVFNAVATESGHLGSLDSARITKQTSFLFGAYFQAEFASLLREAGIKVRVDDRGRAVVIEGIPQEACELFSKRHRQAEQRAKAFVRSQGRDWNGLSADQKFTVIHQANLAYRSAKYTGGNEREIWRAEAAEIGWQHETVLTGTRTEALSDEQRFEQAYETAARMLAAEFRTAAVVDWDAFRTHAAHGLIGVGIKGAEDIQRVAGMLQERGIEIDGERTFFLVREQDGRLRATTGAQIAVEQEMAVLAGAAARSRGGALSEQVIAAAVARSGLDFETEPDHGAAQLAAIRALGQAGGLGFLEGVAGAGKTALLRPLVDAWQADGRTVIGAAMAWRQADALQDAGVEATFALSPLLDRIEKGELQIDQHSVLVIDEVSQVAPRQLLQILRLQKEVGFSVRLLGDREQAQAIEAGDAVEILQRVMPPDTRPALLSTIRQKSARAREIAGAFRSPGRDLRLSEDEQRQADVARARRAIDMKRKDGTIRLVGGDHAQVIADIAEVYLRRRDLLAQAGAERGVTMTAPTNQDVQDLSRAVRERLKQRGEIGEAEIVRPAIDQRGETFDLPLSVGDRVRLYGRVSAQLDTSHGKRWQPLGSNGHIVTVRGWDAEGIILENEKGRKGLVPWTRLTDRDTGRTRLGFGHALTIDAAQGVTSDEHINAMPRGSASVTGFTSYVAESRHVHRCYTLVAEAPLREAERWSRALGDISPISQEDLYDRLAGDMGRHPYKALGVDLMKMHLAHEQSTTAWVARNHANEMARQQGLTPGAGARRQREIKPMAKAPKEHWDDMDRRLRKAAYATQQAMDQMSRAQRTAAEYDAASAAAEAHRRQLQELREREQTRVPTPSGPSR